MNPTRLRLSALTLLALPLLLLAACTGNGGPPAESRTEPAPLILVSLDGFHPDYLQRGLTPTLARLAAEGVRAEWMIPSYPSLTFPNHYTLVTGLRPDRHGIVHNTMRDPELGEFALHRRQAVEDGRWWGGEPLWVGARRHGLRTATMFWPGSEAEIAGLRPHDWLPFSKDMSPADRVDTLLSWLDRDPPRRPRFMTLYFEQIDTAGHDHGPGSPEHDTALAAVDAALARLMAGLEARGLADSVNLVVTSDHGMAATSTERLVFIDERVDPETAEIRTLGEVIGIEPLLGHEREVEAALLDDGHPHLPCWRKAELPARWHYGSHPRIPAIVCQADVGWEVITREQFSRWGGRVKPGAHGFDPGDPSMRALFVARGPAFRRGAVLPPFENVHVYPLLAALLGIPAADNDGDPAVLAPALR